MFADEPGAFPDNRGITIHTLKSGIGALSPLLAHQTGRPILTGSKISRILEAKQFDVIHFHNSSLFGPAVLRLNPSYPTVKLYTAHEYWLVCPVNFLWKNRQRACEKPECVTCMLHWGRPPQLWRYSSLLQNSLDDVDEVFTPSRFSRDMHRERGLRRDVKVLPYFQPKSDPSSGDPSTSPHPRPYYLFVGRIEDYKGVQTILPAFEGPGDHDLVVVGTGSYDAELAKQAAGMKRVHCVGWVNQTEIARYYQHALATIVPSIGFETFGIVMLESFAEGTPVIAHNRGPLPEVVEDSGGGLIYDTGHELARHVAHLADDATRRQELGRRGQEAWRRLWSAEAHLDAYLGHIARLRAAKVPA